MLSLYSQFLLSKTTNFVVYYFSENFKNAVYTKKAKFLFENYPASNELIGKPFRYKNIDLGDTRKNFVFEHEAQVIEISLYRF